MNPDNVIKIEFAGSGSPGSGGTGSGGSHSGSRKGGSSQGVNIDEILAAHRIRVESEKRSEANRAATKHSQSMAGKQAAMDAAYKQEEAKNTAERERVAELTRSNALERQIDAADAAAVRKKKGDKKAEIAKAERAVADQRQKIQTAGIGGMQMAGPGMQNKIGGILTVAGSGMLGGQAAALAGGPVGAAIMAGLAVKSAISSTISGAAQSATHAATDLISGNPAAAVGRVADKVGDAISFIGGPQAQVGVEAARATVEMAKAAINRGKELSGYNSNIAGAMGTADARTIMADVAEAQRNGGKYASLIDSESRLEHSLRRIFDPLKDSLISTLEVLARHAADTAESLEGAGDFFTGQKSKEMREAQERAKNISLLGQLEVASADLDALTNNGKMAPAAPWFAQIPMQFQQGN
jgi:hypothetical protein